jgi:hypothetical protein
MNLLRWILVIPAAISAWFGVLLLGLIAMGVLDMFCPPELVVSGSCTAAWHESAMDALIVMFAGMSAVAVVIAPAIVAPMKRNQVATLAFVIGVLVATGMTLEDPSMMREPYVAAITGGLAALLLVRRHLPRPAL